MQFILVHLTPKKHVTLFSYKLPPDFRHIIIASPAEASTISPALDTFENFLGSKGSLLRLERFSVVSSFPQSNDALSVCFFLEILGSGHELTLTREQFNVLINSWLGTVLLACLLFGNFPKEFR